MPAHEHDFRLDKMWEHCPEIYNNDLAPGDYRIRFVGNQPGIWRVRSPEWSLGRLSAANNIIGHKDIGAGTGRPRQLCVYFI